MRNFINIVEAHNVIVAYHGSSTPIELFYPLTHFGSLRAAKERMAFKNAQKQYLHKVSLRIINPLRVDDNEASDEATLLNARIKGKYLDLNLNILRSKGTVAALADAGYDGMVYQNRMEDMGQDSWVITNSDQVIRSQIVTEAGEK